MHQLVLNIEDELLGKLHAFMKKLPKKDVEIISDKKITTSEEVLDFSRYRIPSFKQIEDPVQWQIDIRSEWDR